MQNFGHENTTKRKYEMLENRKRAKTSSRVKSAVSAGDDGVKNFSKNEQKTSLQKGGEVYIIHFVTV